ncbi:MAG: hypothetical protein MUF66_05440 [Gammaproteobacteria bacterium]|nr:hypothetical protein [Gammaproteobacteria bacterium]
MGSRYPVHVHEALELEASKLADFIGEHEADADPHVQRIVSIYREALLDAQAQLAEWQGLEGAAALAT